MISGLMQEVQKEKKKKNNGGSEPLWPKTLARKKASKMSVNLW